MTLSYSRYDALCNTLYGIRRWQSFMEQHPLSAAFGQIPDDEYVRLQRSIAKHGLLSPVITTYQNKVLDGWHRFTICTLNSIDFETRRYEGDDPIGFVMGQNEARRHQGASQRAAVRARLEKLRPEYSATEPESGKNLPRPSVRQMAKQASVSHPTMISALKAEDAGLGDDVISGKLSVSQAANICHSDTPQKPKPPPTKREAKRSAVEADLQDAREQIAALEAEIRDLQDEVDVHLARGSTDERILVLAAINRALTSQLDGLKHERNEDQHSLDYWKSWALDNGHPQNR